jgi:SNF2 family DNA or RNA helicase
MNGDVIKTGLTTYYLLPISYYQLPITYQIKIMSNQKNQTTQPSIPTWLRYLDLQQLTDSGSFDIEKILRHKYKYTEVPVLEPRERVVATLNSDCYIPPHKKGSEPSAGPFTVTLRTPSRGSYSSIGIDANCTSGEKPYSEPAVSLLIDLAIYPALREAVMNGEAVEPLLETLPAVREQAYRDYQAHQALQFWAPKEQLQVAPSPTYALSIYDTVSPYRNRYYMPYFNNNPHVEVRPRLPGKRAILSDNDTKDMRFPPADGQILRYCRPMYQNRKGFIVEGSTVALVLHLLQDREVKLEGEDVPVIFAKSPVFLKMVVTRLPRKQIGKRNTLKDPPDRYHPSVIDEEEPEPEDPTLDVTVNALEARWYTRDGEFDISSADAVLIAGLYSYLWVPEQHTVYPISHLVDTEAAWRLFLVPSINLVEGHGPMLYRAFRHQLQGTLIALPPPVEIGLSPAEMPEFKLRIDGEPLAVQLHLEAHYTFGILPLFPGPSLEEFVGTRDVELEDAALEQMTRLNFRENAQNQCFMSGNEEQAAWFWLEGIELLKQAEPKITLMMPAKLQSTKVRKKLKARLKVSLVSGWFDTEVQINAEELDINLAQLQEAVEHKKRWVTLNDGSLAELTEELRDLLQDGLDVLSESGKARLAVYQLGRLNNWMQSSEVAVEVDEQIEEMQTRSALFSRLAKTGEAAVPVEPELPQKLNAELRPYQSQGIAWLQFLHELSAGGVLADDMGLGKTLMTLTLLSWRKEQDGGMPNLIVCPTSVTTNWLKETARFTPTLKTALLTGKERETLRSCIKTNKAGKSQLVKKHFNASTLRDVDIMVTSYGLLRRDVDMLELLPCRYIVLDEAQNIKNYDTATAKAARRLQGEGRLALSGTPVENRLVELYSLMDFCNPGMLGSKKLFSRRFEYPILSDSRGPAARLLRATIRPFVLRRTKRQVLKELPPKQEIEHLCVLGVEQQQRYDALAGIVRGDIAHLIKTAQGLAKNQIKLLTALLRLRQMACDPRLVDRTVPAAQSVKRNEFLQLVRELVSEGRRALVFSQFVELLHLWQRDLERDGIAYEYLDGSTKNREDVIDRFQNGDAPLFLISLKAGGTGLNLTAADTVIHCDPWWNPAVEDQATDRAHRIGQTKPVTVYRLVAAGTVEEKIIQLKARKKELANAVITDDSAALRGLKVEDVQLLLGDVSATQFEESDEEEDSDSAAQPEEELLPLPPTTTTAASASILDKTTGEELQELGRMMQAWLVREEKKQKHLAKALGISSYTIGQLLRGKKKSMPTLEYQRAKALLESFGIK